MSFEEAVADFPKSAVNLQPPNVGYTPWHLAEHVRRTQVDILEYIRDRSYVSPEWPVEYWPKHDETTDARGFARTVDAFRADLDALVEIAADPDADLFAPIPETPGHTIYRELRTVADHTAYHTGEFAILRQVMGTWPPDHDR